MKKIVILCVLVVVAVAVVLAVNFLAKKNVSTKVDNTNSNNTQNQVIENDGEKNQEAENQEVEVYEEENNGESQEDGYEIIVSKKELTIEKGSEESFEIVFTNPDESAIREYITPESQDDIISVSYSPLEDRKITVNVKALKVGTSEISICDFEYPDRKEIVKVNVTDN